ncbi:AlbA family DNA-binding domain-containing protein [Aquirufa sp. ROCK2-A2]
MKQGSEVLLGQMEEEGDVSLLTLAQIKSLAKQGEGQHLEFKMKVKFPEKIVRELVAFANSSGGKLLIGVSDDGDVQGLKFADEDQFVLNKAIEKYCFPAFSYTHYRVSLDHNKSILVYDIFESVDKPHFVQLENETQPKCYVRIKDRSVQASKEMKQILRRENEEGIQFTYGDSEKWLMNYLAEKGSITLEEFCSLHRLPLWLASRKLVLLVLCNVLRVEPGESYDIYRLK